jgi:hypothetical protein
MDEWIRKTLYINLMFVIINNKRFLPFSTTLMKLEDIILKDKEIDYINSVYMESKNVKFTEAESKVFSRGGEQKKT